MRRCKIIYGHMPFIIWDEVNTGGETTRYAVRRDSIEGLSLVHNGNSEYELRVLTNRRCVCMFFDNKSEANGVLQALAQNTTVA